MISVLGVFVLLALAVLFSESRRDIKAGPAIRTFLLQVAIAVFVLVTPMGVSMLAALSDTINNLLAYANDGISFVFGALVDRKANGIILAFQILPVIVFVASLFAVLYYLRIMPAIIYVLGSAVRFITGATRIESTFAAACVFVGSAEAPLVVLPYLSRISRSQLFVLMTVGMASVAGTVLVAYVALGIPAELLLCALFMSAPGGLLMGRLLVPQVGEAFDVESTRSAGVEISSAHNLVEAAMGGALVGMKIMWNIVAVLIAFIALIALLNGIIGGIGGLLGHPEASLEALFSYLFAPAAWLIGVPWEEATRSGVFLGQKLVLNEFLAYANFSPTMGNFSDAGRIATTIALCGFANLTGLAVLLASLGAVVPERQGEISRLGIKALLAGTLSNLLSAAIVSTILAIAGNP